MAVRRTFGWIQNPGDLKTLKKVVGVFCPDSAENRWLRTDRLRLLRDYGLISKENYNLFCEALNKKLIEISYGLLKGRGPGSGSRRDALCTGIIQAVIDGQQNKIYMDSADASVSIKKPYTDDWTADGYLRWAVSCGLLSYDRDKDTCKLSPLGMSLIHSHGDPALEQEILETALLSYPPVIRILSLLKEQDNQTKFELGNRLGFKGELGFTSIPQEIYLCDYCNASTPAEKSAVRNNDEGDSDKYARGIASWLIQMGWVTTSTETKSGVYRGKTYSADLQVYTLTRDGEKALKRAKGNSRNPRLPRTVLFEMLASNKAPGADSLRYQRACLLKTLSTTAGDLEQLYDRLTKIYDLTLDTNTIKDHIAGLCAIGLDLSEDHGVYALHDKIIGLTLPSKSICVSDSVNDLKNKVRSKLASLDHKYLILIDLAYSDASTKAKKNADAREFEIQTANLLTKELAFHGMRLGDSNRPDVIISYGTKGTILDNKSYKDGFSLNRQCADEMGRYINENNQRLPGIPANEWWKEFESDVTEFTFLFVTSYLKGQLEQQLNYLSTLHFGIKGAAISAEHLLYFAEGIKSGHLTYDDFFDSFDNKELSFPLT